METMFAVLVLACTAPLEPPVPQDSTVDPVTDTGEPFEIPRGALILDNARIVDALGARDGAIVIDDDWIVGVVDPGADWPGGVTVLDLEGFSVIPGLIDSHVHMALSGVDWWIGDTLKENLLSTLAWGVTAVVDVGGPAWTIGLAHRIATAEVFGPRMVASGPFLTAEGSHPCETRFHRDVCIFVGEDAEEALGTVTDFGPQRLKLVYADYDFTPWPTPRLDLGAVEQITSAGLPVVGHVASGADAADLFAAGVEILAHTPFDAPLSTDVAGLPFRAIHSTVSAFAGLEEIVVEGADLEGAEYAHLPSEVRASWRWLQQHPDSYDPVYLSANTDWLANVKTNLAVLKQAGATVIAGSDAGYAMVAHGSGLHRELEALVEAGWTEVEAIAAATWLPAQDLGWYERGLVDAGYLSELVVVRGDPSMDIRAASEVEALVLSDNIFELEDLLNQSVWQAPGTDMCIDDRDCEERCDRVDHVCAEACPVPYTRFGVCDESSWCAPRDGLSTTTVGVCHKGDGCDWRLQDCGPESYQETCVPADVDTSYCWPSGLRTAGESCDWVNPESFCEPGLLCSWVDSTCYELCDPHALANSCGVGSCQVQQAAPGVDWFGLCL